MFTHKKVLAVLLGFSLQGRQKSDLAASREARKAMGDVLLIVLWNAEALVQLPTGSSQHTSGGGRVTSA